MVLSEHPMYPVSGAHRYLSGVPTVKPKPGWQLILLQKLTLGTGGRRQSKSKAYCLTLVHQVAERCHAMIIIIQHEHAHPVVY